MALPPIRRRIMIVDDDRGIRESIAAFLNSSGYEASMAADAAIATAHLPELKPDLVLLDVMLPGEDGLALCRRLTADAAPPVILMSALIATSDRIEGLRAGGDDYICKPFDPDELLLRIEAVLRRAPRLVRQDPSIQPLVYRFDRWEMDVDARLLIERESGVRYVLSNSEIVLLETLIKRAERVLSREQLLELVSGESGEVFDRSIDSRISRIRRKLEANPRQPRIIQTVRGGGYRFAVRVTRVG